MAQQGWCCHSPHPTPSQVNISAANTKPPSPRYKAQQLSPAASSAHQPQNKTQHGAEICSPGHKSWTAWQRSCSHRCAQGHQPRLSRLRRKASPTLNPVTSTTPRVSSGRGKAKRFHSGSRGLPGEPQLPSCLRKITCSQSLFPAGEEAGASSQGSHLCHWAEPGRHQSRTVSTHPPRDAHQHRVQCQQGWGSPSPLAPGCLCSASS